MKIFTQNFPVIFSLKSKFIQALLGAGFFLGLVGITPAFAYMEGFYIGGGVNYNWFAYDYELKEKGQPQSQPLSDYNKSNAKDNNFGGQVIFGYTWLLPVNHKYFVSVEGFANFFSADATSYWVNTLANQDTATSFSASIQNAYGFVVKPGISITDEFNVFIQAGLAFSQLKNMVYHNPAALGEGVPVKYDNENLYGYRFGLGAQYKLTENLVAELAWALTYYDDFRQTQPTSRSAGGLISAEAEIELNAIRTNQAFLNLNYYF